MKQFIIILLGLVPFLVFGQCYPYSNFDFLKAEVSGDTAVLRDDTACRNCGSFYVMEITRLNGDTLKWMQTDVGYPGYCECPFNLSVTIDSLSPGSYTVLVYDRYSSSYLNYIGSISFVITELNSFSVLQKHDQYQSHCLLTGTNEVQKTDVALKVYPNPTSSKLNIVTYIIGDKIIRISDLQNKTILEFNSDKKENIIDISNLSDNMYFVTVKSKEKLFHAKFIKD